MKRTEWLQETRKMRFEEAYENYISGRITQEDAVIWFVESEKVGAKALSFFGF